MMAETTTDGMVRVARSGSFVLGLVYLAVGLAGWLVTGGEDFFATNTGDRLFGLELNPAHNVVHLLVGAALVAGSLRETAARGVLLVVAAAYGVVGVAGFWLVGTGANILSLNTADNWLHIGTALVALALAAASALASDRRSAGATDR